MRPLLLVAALLLTGFAFAQPTNDNCSNAINVPISATGACNNQTETRQGHVG